MHIEFEHKGIRYPLTKEGQIIYIDYQKNSKQGDKISFRKVLSDGERFGHPYLDDMEILAEVEKNVTSKIHFLGYKPKKRNSRKLGHCMRRTKIKIIDIRKHSIDKKINVKQEENI